jgi:hypothetical protein
MQRQAALDRNASVNDKRLFVRDRGSTSVVLVPVNGRRGVCVTTSLSERWLVAYSWKNSGASIRQGAVMRSVRAFLRKPSKRRRLSWLGAAVAIVPGIWAVVTYVWPAHEAPTAVCAVQGIAIGGSAFGSKFTNKTLRGTTISGPCVDTDKK